MSMKDLREAFRLIDENKKKGRFGEEKDEELIQLAEKALGLKFPPTYRLFLKNYGHGGIRGSEIYGIINADFETPGVPDGIWCTLDQRKKWGLPSTHIIISDTGDGFWYVLDSSESNTAGEYPVFIYYGLDEGKKSQEKINEDFGEFFLEETKSCLEDDEDDD